MKILVLNCGSSSLKYQLIDMSNEQVLCKGLCERIGIEGSVLTHQVPGKDKVVTTKAMPDHSVAVQMVAISESVVVDDKAKAIIKDCTPLGPLHIPANLMGIEACEKVVPGKKNVAVFDTSFGMSMPKKAYIYAVPYEYLDKYSLRRYGFHGTSHMFVTNEVIKFGNLGPNAKVIVCHLGNGSSVSASIGGKCVDTSMGLTPLEGLIMGTRCGDIDAGAVQYIANKENIDINETLNILNKKSGVLGISGVSSDFRDLDKAASEGNERAKLAIEAFQYRVAKYIGAYVAAMNGVDAIAFTAGVGENDKEAKIQK